MIIAFALFIVSCVAVITSFIIFITEKRRNYEWKEARDNLWIYFIILICSAQYIWGGNL